MEPRMTGNNPPLEWPHPAATGCRRSCRSFRPAPPCRDIRDIRSGRLRFRNRRASPQSRDSRHRRPRPARYHRIHRIFQRRDKSSRIADSSSLVRACLHRLIFRRDHRDKIIGVAMAGNQPSAPAVSSKIRLDPFSILHDASPSTASATLRPKSVADLVELPEPWLVAVSR